MHIRIAALRTKRDYAYGTKPGFAACHAALLEIGHEQVFHDAGTGVWLAVTEALVAEPTLETPRDEKFIHSPAQQNMLVDRP